MDRNLWVAAALGRSNHARQFPLGLRAAEIRAARELLAATAGRPVDGFVAALPGGRWESKLWPPDRWAELIDRLHAERGLPCLLLGAPADRDGADQIIARCTSPVLDFVGRTTLRQLVALLALADCAICHDSGPMHIAAALNTPLVAIFGPTDPSRTGPCSAAARVVALPLPCAPCGRRTCPLGHHGCMRQLRTEAVLAEVRELAPAGPRAARERPAAEAAPSGPLSGRGTHPA